MSITGPENRKQGAVLYLFGGGYILPPDPGDIILCGQIAENCNAEVWFPLYPMVPDNDLVHTLQGTLGVYRDMLEHYDADRIRFFGTSSGGGQALSLCMYIRHEGLDVPLPGRLVLQSPGLQVPPSDRQRAEMDRLSHLGTHTIRIERFDSDCIRSRESNEHVPVWNHKIYLKDCGRGTEYTDEVDIEAGWKTVFIWLWANAFYAHRQRKWIRLLKEK